MEENPKQKLDEKLRNELAQAVMVNSGVDFLALELEDKFKNKRVWKKFVRLSHKTARTYYKALEITGHELDDFMAGGNTTI